MRVAVVFNLKRASEASLLDAEYDNPETIAAICAALRSRGEVPLPVEASASVGAALHRLRPDLVFNLAEGCRGEAREAQVPALLEMLGLAYTGSGVLATAVCLDKPTCKRLLQAAGISTPRFRVVRPGAEAEAVGMPLPCFVKPAHEGSSLGISEASICGDEQALLGQVRRIHARFHQPALVEAYLPGREFSVGLVGNDPPHVLPILEARCGVYGERVKRQPPDERLFPCPAPLDEVLRRDVADLALAAFAVTGCSDVARVDIRLDATGRPQVLEVNPLPGLAPGWSDLSRQAAAAGLSHADLVGAIVDAAVARQGMRHCPVLPEGSAGGGHER